jgi:hypothetical protein
MMSESLPPSGLRQTTLFPMSSAAGFRAKTFRLPLPIARRGSTASAAGFGRKLRDWLAKYDRSSSSWRTSQTCLLGTGELGSAQFSGTWPRSGLMRSGTAYRLPELVPLTSVTEYGWWPTPRASDRDNCGGANARQRAQRNGTYIGRDQNPELSEWLMGFPIGWSALPLWETP